ncbi:MAG: hypothetical protein WEA24_09590 [Gemmatimonadota bacterium]
MFKKRVAATALSVSLLMMAAGTAAGDDLQCKCKTLTYSGGWDHNFNSNGELPYECDYSDGEFDYPCHIDTLDGSCSGVHRQCGPDFAFDAEMSVVELAMYSGFVYNRDRQALQMVGCNGVVTASFKVAPELRFAVLEQLAARYV